MISSSQATVEHSDDSEESFPLFESVSAAANAEGNGKSKKKRKNRKTKLSAKVPDNAVSVFPYILIGSATELIFLKEKDARERSEEPNIAAEELAAKDKSNTQEQRQEPQKASGPDDANNLTVEKERQAREEAMKAAEIEASNKEKEQQARKAREEAIKAAELEAAKKAAEEKEQRDKAAREEAIKAAELEAAKKAAEEKEQRDKAAREEAIKAAELEAAKKAAEEKEQRDKKAKEEAIKAAELEAAKKAAEQQARVAREEAADEAKRAAAAAEKDRIAREASRKAEEEEERLRVEAKKAADEAAKLQQQTRRGDGGVSHWLGALVHSLLRRPLLLTASVLVALPAFLFLAFVLFITSPVRPSASTHLFAHHLMLRLSHGDATGLTAPYSRARIIIFSPLLRALT